MQQEHGIRYFPIALFSSVMGFSGIAIAMRNVEVLYNMNHIISIIFLFISTLLFFVNGCILIYRFVCHFDEVNKDFSHPVKVNFFAAISISMLLLAVVYFDVNESLSFIIWVIGAVLQLSLTLIILTNLMFRSSFQITHFSPAWFIPIVGNIVVPLAGVFHVDQDINSLFFGIGILFSIIYMTVFINRIYFHEGLPNMLIPTLFILMAPPAIGFSSYLKLAGGIDTFAYILYGIAFLIGLLLLFQFKLFIKLPFFISWWSFLFPSAAMTIATIQMYVETGKVYYEGLVYLQMIGLVLLAVYLSYKTLQLVKHRTLCLKDS